LQFLIKINLKTGKNLNYNLLKIKFIFNFNKVKLKKRWVKILLIQKINTNFKRIKIKLKSFLNDKLN